MPQSIDDDNTIRLTRPGAQPPRPPTVPPQETSGRLRPPVRPSWVSVWAIVATVLVVVLAGAGCWLLWPATPPATRIAGPAAVPHVAALSPAAPPATRGLQALPPPTPANVEFSIETASERQILFHVSNAAAADPTVFRFAANPRILVLDFASLLDQGRMLNRVAALVEKSGLPHDRVLTSFEIGNAIRANGDTVETFYYGHDYDAGSVIRFFALADRDNIRLLREEDQLGRLIRQAGWFEPNAQAALISVPQVGADAHVTRAARATILHHELSHGEYFTNPAYVAFVHQFWTLTLTAAERDRIRRYLRSEGYDQGLDEVMENEAQAYLIFTDGADFFTPEMIDMSPARLAELRTGFFQAMPPGWLRDSLGLTLGVNQSASDRP